MEERLELVKFCHKVYEKGFVSATDGNLSLRLDSKRILITPSGKNKGEVEPEDLLIIDYFGNKLFGKGKVTTEVKIHLLAYNSRPEVNAVVHCHPVYATAFATAGVDLSQPVFPEVILSIGEIPLCRYGTPSTDELPDSMKPFINYAWAFLLQNHGAVTLGVSIEDAYFKMEKLEHAAQTIFIAKILGGANPLSKENIEKLLSIAEKTYGVKPKFKLNEFTDGITGNENRKQNTSQTGTYTEIIENRLKSRAGNPKVNPFDVKSRLTSDEQKYQNTINIEEINKIIKEFKF